MYQEEHSTKISPILLLGTGIIAFILIGVFLIQIINSKKIPYNDNLNISIVDASKWTKCKTVVVNEYQQNIQSYSFDNGQTWQESNMYEACEAATLTVKVRNKKEKEVGKGTIKVDNIDYINPTILVQDIVIKQYEPIDLTSDVTVTDGESGIDGFVTCTPATIDTSKLGDVTVTYRVYDKTGNMAEKERVITIVGQDN